MQIPILGTKCMQYMYYLLMTNDNQYKSFGFGLVKETLDMIRTYGNVFCVSNIEIKTKEAKMCKISTHFIFTPLIQSHIFGGSGMYVLRISDGQLLVSSTFSICAVLLQF